MGYKGKESGIMCGECGHMMVWLDNRRWRCFCNNCGSECVTERDPEYYDILYAPVDEELLYKDPDEYDPDE